MPQKPKPRKQREGWGRVRKLPSGRFQASYQGPDLAVHNASTTFQTMTDARVWLTVERQLIDAGKWSPPKVRASVSRAETLRAYAEPWLTARDLKPRTRDLYRRLLDQKILPQLGDMPLKAISPLTVREWHANEGLWTRTVVVKPGPDEQTTKPKTKTLPTPTRRAHSYALLRTILGSAVTDGLIASNPCVLRGAGQSKREHKIQPASAAELDALIAALPERYGCIVLLATWCAMRWGELVELRRKDLDLKNGKVRVRRSAQVVNGQVVVGPPKSDAGVRDIAIPPHLIPVIRAHVDRFGGWGRDGLVFPAAQSEQQLAHGTFFKTWNAARTAAGRPDLRFHDLRHTGAVMAAQTGATLAELMGRLGHSTPAMAIRYQHVAQDRDAEIARRLSEMAGAQA